MQIFIFSVGLCVSIMVIYGIFSLVPRELRPPEKIVYRKDSEQIGS